MRTPPTPERAQPSPLRPAEYGGGRKAQGHSPDDGSIGNRAARLSLIGAIVILALKLGAFLLTGSISLLSDAAESLVNLVAAGVLMVALSVARAPADYQHPYGHSKAEYLSSVLEAALIMVAAVVIGWTAVGRLLAPQELNNVTAGVIISTIAAVLNGGLALYLHRVARQQRSAALQANARHLLTDVYTSVGVIVGVVLVSVTGWGPIDPIIALVVAANIVWVGVRVMRPSLSNLLDERLPEEEEAVIITMIEATPSILGFHRLRTRRSGRRRFAEVDVFVAADMTVAQAHDLVVDLEDRVHDALSDLETTVHVEPFVAGVREESRTPREEFGEQD